MNARTTMSTKGQVVVPRAVRVSRGWEAGSQLEFVEKGDDIVLRLVKKADPRFPKTDWDEFQKHRIKYDGPPVSVEDMNKAVLEEAARRWNAKDR